MFYVDLYNLCIYYLIEKRFKTRRYVYLQVWFWHPIFKNIPDISPSPINFSGRCGRHLEHCPSLGRPRCGHRQRDCGECILQH